MHCSDMCCPIPKIRLTGGFTRLLAALVTVVSLTVLAADGITRSVQAISKFQYNEQDGKITILGYTGTPSNGNLVIPVEINGQPVTAIGASAFQNRRDLVSVTMPETLETIGANAFDGCGNLQEVVLNDGLQEIAEAAFMDSGLQSVVFPDTVTRIGNSAFCGTRLETVVFNEGLEDIDDYAFQYCLNLRAVSIPGSVTRIGDGAFYECYNLTDVTLNEGLEVIGDYAFGDTTYLTAVTIPASVNSIGYESFPNARYAIFAGAPPDYCDFLYVQMTLYVKPGFGWEDYIEDGSYNATIICGYLLYVNGHVQGCYAEGEDVQVNVPACEGFQGWSSEDIELTEAHKLAQTLSFTMPAQDVRLIAACEREYTPESYFDYEIEDNEAIITYYFGSERDVLIPPFVGEDQIPVTAIGEGAFYGSFVQSVEIPEGVCSIGYGAFQECFELTDVTLPSTLLFIDEYAFGSCKSLKQIDLPMALQDIESCAFCDCIQLMRIAIPAATEIICEDTFDGCCSLAAIDVDADNETYSSVDGVLFTKDMSTLCLYPAGKPGISYAVPASVEAIGINALYDTQLQDIILPDGLAMIMSCGIRLTSNTSEIIIPASVQALDSYSLTAASICFLGEPPEFWALDSDDLASETRNNPIIFALPNKGWEDYETYGELPVVIITENKPVISRLDGMTGTDFTGELQIEITGEPTMADAILRYTTDGSQPDDASTAYTAPVTLTNYATIKAAFFSPDGTMLSAVATSVFYRVQPLEPFDDSELTFNTYGDFFWFTDELDAQNQAAHSSVTDDDNGWGILSTTVQGPGTITFSWRNEAADEELSFSIDGFTVTSCNSETWQTISYDITTPGPHQLAWTLIAWNSANNAWVDHVTWTPDNYVTAPLANGWTMLALTADIPDTPENQAVLQDLKPFLMNMDTDTCCMATLPLTAGQVLWIYSDSPRNLSFITDQTIPDTMELPELTSGWSVIGIYGKDDVPLPEGYAAWTWDSGCWKPASSPLKPGKGYLIHP